MIAVVWQGCGPYEELRPVVVDRLGGLGASASNGSRASGRVQTGPGATVLKRTPRPLYSAVTAPCQ
ncbi:hypothetical protein [Streptomyces sp. TP-A0356]|uniref:hypothetical protein n=1 Tax=Streptomyces sp. TP-A0356 TaxID=1359208 RepID=UPI0006E3CAA4|nr:hypothetical protein [Streptomyces sp. TP-A0356]